MCEILHEGETDTSGFLFAISRRRSRDAAGISAQLLVFFTDNTNLSPESFHPIPLLVVLVHLPSKTNILMLNIYIYTYGIMARFKRKHFLRP